MKTFLVVVEEPSWVLDETYEVAKIINADSVEEALKEFPHLGVDDIVEIDTKTKGLVYG